MAQDTVIVTMENE